MWYLRPRRQKMAMRSSNGRLSLGSSFWVEAGNGEVKARKILTTRSIKGEAGGVGVPGRRVN